MQQFPTSDAIFYSILILVSFLALFFLYFWGAWIQAHQTDKSPYTGLPLRRGTDLPYESAKKILLFLYERHEYDNRIFDIKKAAYCRETGRVFPDCVTWYNTVHLDWSFLIKRFPGSFVSWGSLSDIQQTIILDSHESLEGYQTAKSCPKPAPSEITREYAYLKPGPLYVDVNTKIVLGWQIVPDTDFEVLIVQRPTKRVV